MITRDTRDPKEKILLPHRLSDGSLGSSIFFSSFLMLGSSMLLRAPATMAGVFENPI